MTENKKVKFIAKRIKKITQLCRRMENLKSVKPFSLGEFWVHMNKIVRLVRQMSITIHEIKDLKVKPREKQFEPGGFLPKLQNDLRQIPAVKHREGCGELDFLINHKGPKIEVNEGKISVFVERNDRLIQSSNNE